eukprot:TRINITY_DN23518_c0_g1_i1.p1 TRINITY_DN23518_c0_g1~~TRINITY_DN23518_c0_g1_i1.p1  ORF type:complete len:558 (+),score=206.88 TRINITY_DN23518_c0_g1_i1:54-1727(+)
MNPEVTFSWSARRRSPAPSDPETPPSSGSRSDATTPPGNRLSFPVPQTDLDTKPRAQLVAEYAGTALVDKLYVSMMSPAIPRRVPGSPLARRRDAQPSSPLSPQRVALRRRREAAVGRRVRSRRPTEGPADGARSCGGSGEGSSSSSASSAEAEGSAERAADGVRAVSEAGSSPCRARAVFSDSSVRHYPALTSSLRTLDAIAARRLSLASVPAAADDSEYEERIDELVDLMTRPPARPSSWFARVQKETADLMGKLREAEGRCEDESRRADHNAVQATAAEAARDEALARVDELQHALKLERERCRDAERDVTREQCAKAEVEMELQRLRSEVSQYAERALETRAAEQAAEDARERERRVEASLQRVKQQLEQHATLLDDAAALQARAERAEEQCADAQSLSRDLTSQLRGRDDALTGVQEQLRAAARQAKELHAARREVAEMAEQLQRVRLHRDEQCRLLEVRAQEAHARAGEAMALLDIERLRGSRAEAALRTAELARRSASAAVQSLEEDRELLTAAVVARRAASEGSPAASLLRARSCSAQRSPDARPPPFV